MQTIHDNPRAPDPRPDRPCFLVHMELTVTEAIAQQIERHEEPVTWYLVE